MPEETSRRRVGLLGRPMLMTADAVGQALVVGPIQGAGFLAFLIGAAAVTALLWQDFLSRHAGFDPRFWPTGLVLIAAIQLLVYIGVRPAVRIQLFLTVLSAVPFLILLVAVVATGGDSGNTASVFNPWRELC